MAFQKRIRPSKLRPYATLTRLILEKISEFGEATISAFFPAKYPEARLWRRILGLDDRYRFRRETFSSVLSRLRAQGLVARRGARQKSVWRLTPRGVAYAAASARADKSPRPDGVRRLVIFDIPERERAKRDAIRLELVAAGFRPLQKSVWYGERPLPEGFLELVDALALARYIHIVSVRDTGTLR